MREGWSHNIDSEDIRHYKKLIDALSTENGCLLYGARIVIPDKLRELGPGTSTFRPLYPTNEAIGSLRA